MSLIHIVKRTRKAVVARARKQSTRPCRKVKLYPVSAMPCIPAGVLRSQAS